MPGTCMGGLAGLVAYGDNAVTPAPPTILYVARSRGGGRPSRLGVAR